MVKKARSKKKLLADTAANTAANTEANTKANTKANTAVTTNDALGAAWQVYILACADGTLYTGVTRDLDRRVRQHNGELVGGASYTRSRRPVRLAWHEGCADRSAAQKREAFIKTRTRAEKLRLAMTVPT